jgi:hypothetical protein
MKAICASVNFDRFMVLPRPAARITYPLNWNFPAMIGPETGKQVTRSYWISRATLSQNAFELAEASD